MEGGEPFAWDLLVPHIVHPLKVTLIEAMWWVRRPLSASDLTKLIDDPQISLSHVTYHAIKLADAGAIRAVKRRRGPSSTEKFYTFA